MLRGEVAVAFDLLLEELESAIEALKRDGMEAFGKGEYASAREVSQQAEQLAELMPKVKDLQREWARLFAGKTSVAMRRSRPGKRTLRERLGRGLRTPEEAFRAPILRALLDLGGSAQLSQVLEAVAVSMRDVMNDYDKQPLPSNPDEIRWRNTAHWCRASLVKEGLLAADSPRGVWAITPAGRTESERMPEG